MQSIAMKMVGSLAIGVVVLATAAVGGDDAFRLSRRSTLEPPCPGEPLAPGFTVAISGLVAAPDTLAAGATLEDVGVVATVRTSALRVLEFDRRVYPFGTTGCLEVRCVVDSVYWGLPADTVTVWLAGYDVPGAWNYDPDWPQRPAAAFAPGTHWFLNGRRTGGGYVCAPPRGVGSVLPVAAVAPMAALGLTTHTMDDLADQATLVIDGRLERLAGRRGDVRVERVLKGDAADLVPVVNISRAGQLMLHRHLDGTFRFFLVGDEGIWRPVDDRLGILAH